LALVQMLDLKLHHRAIEIWPRDFLVFHFSV
jgi:hypothetical protein